MSSQDSNATHAYRKSCGCASCQKAEQLYDTSVRTAAAVVASTVGAMGWGAATGSWTPLAGAVTGTGVAALILKKQSEKDSTADTTSSAKDA